jgi:hypothetical protein
MEAFGEFFVGMAITDESLVFERWLWVQETIPC